MFISVQHELNAIQQQFKDLSSYTKNRAISESLGQIGDKAFTYSIKRTSKMIGIPEKNLRHGSSGKRTSSKPIMSKKKSNSRNLMYEIKVNSRWLHISETYFNPKQKKDGVESQYYTPMTPPKGGGRITHKGTFLAKGKNSGKIIALIRSRKMKTIQGKTKTLKRPILKAVWAFNPANEFMKAHIADDIIKTYTPLIIERYNQKLFQYLNNKKSSPKK